MFEGITVPQGGFRTVLADPPWGFNSWAHDGIIPSRTAASHYDTMTEEELCGLPVAEIAARDCALFMWVVDYHFPQALRVAESWGFRFITCAFVWVKSRNEGLKPRIGMGYWTRKQTEQCWLFTRGSPRCRKRSIEQVIHCPRGSHSAKPEIIYERIESLVDGPRIELFTRNTRPGWTAWGNQAGLNDLPLFAWGTTSPSIRNPGASDSRKNANGRSAGRARA